MTRPPEPSAAALMRALSAPIYNPILKKEVGHGVLDYEVYVQTRALLALQTRAEELVIPDELVFQVMHQTQELWLKVLAYEAVTFVDTLDRDALPAAGATLDRMITVTRCLGAEIRILQTLAPGAFQTIRRQLGNGSGLESPGYNQVGVAAVAAAAAFERLLARRATTLLALYNVPASAPDVHRIAEQLVDLDEAYQTWLFAHFMLVRRTIGVDKTVRALDNFPTVALAPRMTKPLFPDLWAVRVEMTRSWDRDGGYAPGAPRAPEQPSGTHVASSAFDAGEPSTRPSQR